VVVLFAQNPAGGVKKVGREDLGGHTVDRSINESAHPESPLEAILNRTTFAKLIGAKVKLKSVPHCQFNQYLLKSSLAGVCSGSPGNRRQ
jgi:hypothetical protein